MFDERALEDYLHSQIPLSAAMGVSVVSADGDGVLLRAPLGPNVNHKKTVFGGSASAVAILAAWSVLHLRLIGAGRDSEIVIQSNEMAYEKPITSEFEARAALADPSAWPRFLTMFDRKGRARLEIGSVLTCGGTVVGGLRGSFVALRRHPRI